MERGFLGKVQNVTLEALARQAAQRDEAKCAERAEEERRRVEWQEAVDTRVAEYEDELAKSVEIAAQRGHSTAKLIRDVPQDARFDADASLTNAAMEQVGGLFGQEGFNVIPVQRTHNYKSGSYDQVYTYILRVGWPTDRP